MADKVVDITSKRDRHEHKKKEAKVEALRRAFRLARGAADKKPSRPWHKRKNP